MKTDMPLEVVILAAGQGSRMHSDLPKVLLPIAGKAMLQHVIDTANHLAPSGVHIVYGHGGEAIQAQINTSNIHWIAQTQQQGTGHALLQALPHLQPSGHTLVLYGDVPLISVATLQQLVKQAQDSGCALLTANMQNPHGLGRILRDEATNINQIIEEKDTNVAQRQIHECYSGLMCVSNTLLQRWLPELDNDNAQQEYYLTQLIALVVQAGEMVSGVFADNETEVSGVNDRMQLACLERHYQRQQAEALLRAGVSIADPARLDVRGALRCGKDVYLDCNVICEGKVSLGNGVHIEANVILRDVSIADHVRVKANSVIEGAVIEDHCQLGPFARIRPGTYLASGARVGNFVEIKKSRLGAGSKANHLSYIGDASVGDNVNIGAGTITCNYDGVNKYQTTIESDVFIGTNVALIAPVTIGEGANIGAGSVISKQAPAGKLTLARAKQKTIEHWRRPVKDD